MSPVLYVYGYSKILRVGSWVSPRKSDPGTWPERARPSPMRHQIRRRRRAKKRELVIIKHSLTVSLKE